MKNKIKNLSLINKENETLLITQICINVIIGNYINISQDNKENKKAISNVASKVILNLSKDSNIFNDNNYLNFSIDNDNAESALVASMVMHQPHELGLVQRLSGSNPDWGASVFSKYYKQEFKKIIKLILNLIRK